MKNNFIYILSALIIMMLSGCGKTLLEQDLDSSSGGSGVDTLTGAVLYEANCAICHGPLSSTLKPDRTSSQISEAISSLVPQMSFLSTLTDDEISLISEALISTTVPPVNDTADPIISALSHTGASGGDSVAFNLATNEGATCKYSSDSNATFEQMILMSSDDLKNHTATITGTVLGAYYHYYAFCRDESDNTSAKASYPFQLLDNQVANGIALYAANCVSCHLPIEISPKKNRNAFQIQTAIDTVSTMNIKQYLTDLTSTEVNDIAAALAANLNGGTVVNPDKIRGASFVSGTRRYLSSKFKNLFVGGSNTADDQLIASRIDEDITNNESGFFGGNCTTYDDNCPGSIHEVKFSGSMSPATSAIRRGTILKLCNKVLSVDRAAFVFLDKINLNFDSSASNVNMTKALDLFYPGIKLPLNVLQELSSLHSLAKDQGHSNTKAWKMVLLTMCQSTLFETF